MKKILTKKQLLNERAVDYDPQHPERMHPKIERKLSDRTHDLGAHPAFPSTTTNQNFEEKIASDRFKDTLSKVKRYHRTENVNQRVVMETMQALDKVTEIESQHEEELKELAVKLVKKELGIKNQIDFIPEFVKKVDMSNMQKNPKENEMEIEDAEELDNVQDELKKRRLVNSLIQGASKKGHYMFHLVEDKLNQINPDLVNLYGMIMSVGDLQYWMVDDDMITDDVIESTSVGKSTIGTAGDQNDPREESEIPEESLRDEKYYVHAVGKFFPVIVHELIKGAMEILSLPSLPTHEDDTKSEKVQRYLIDKSDFVKGETWDLRLGPGIWEKFLDAIGEDSWEVKDYLYQYVIKMPPQEFNAFMKEILAGTQKGKRELSRLAGEIKSGIIRHNYEQSEYERKKSEKDMKDSEKNRREEERKRKKDIDSKKAEDDFYKSIENLMRPKKPDQDSF